MRVPRASVGAHQSTLLDSEQPAAHDPAVDEAVVRTEGITKRFADLVAVDHLDLEVRPGEVFGLLGQNGSGKTTLIRMLNTLLSPTEGRAWVCGFDVVRHPEAVRSVIGVVPQNMTSDPDLTAWENMDLYARFYGVGRRRRRRLIEQLLQHVRLWEFRDKYVGAFSGGMRRRLEIARGLVHQPKLLILDEPTLGLDPQSRRNVWQLIRAFLEQFDLTVMLTTHYLEEAENLCHRVALIEKGKLIASGSPEELIAGTPGGDRIELSVAPGTAVDWSFLSEVSGVESVESDGASARVRAGRAAEIVAELLRCCEQRGIRLAGVQMGRATLEDAFIHHVGHAIRDEVSAYSTGWVEKI